MDKVRKTTTMGGTNCGFSTTDWTSLANPQLQQQMLELLARRYWKPIYWYLTRKGYDNEKAKDLTQGFFCEVVLGRQLIQKADRSRGKFRSLLLTALNHYTCSVHRRPSERPVLPLPEFELEELPEHLPVDPEKILDYAALSNLLDEVLRDLKQECQKDGKGIHWQVFYLTREQPILNQRKAPSMAEICKKLGIPDEATASNMRVTVERRFRRLVMRKLSRQEGSVAKGQKELQYLMALF